MSEELEFALLGDPTLPLTDQLPESEWAKPYAQRPRVTIAVDLDNSLEHATQLAFTSFENEGISGNYSYAGVFYAFHSEFDDDGMADRRGRISTTVTLVTPDGHAMWNQPAGAATVRQLLEAGEAEAILGDPRRPYVVLNPPMGNGIFGSWQDIVRAWTVFWTLLEHADVVGGLAGLAVLIRDEVRQRAASRMAAVLERSAPKWEERHAAAHDIGSFLDERPRSTQSLSRLLDLAEEDVQTLCLGRGFTQNASGLWVPGSDEPAQLLHNVASTLDWTSAENTDEEIARRLRLITWGQDPFG